jgi:hypothetical protein
MHRYILKNPGEAPAAGEIKLTLQQLQRFVGGYVENLPAAYKPGGATFDVYMNEEGLLKRLPLNLMIGVTPIVGPVVILAHDSEGEVRSLTAKEERQAMAWLAGISVPEGATRRLTEDEVDRAMSIVVLTDEDELS